MIFRDFNTNIKLINRLEDSIKSGKVSHGYIFVCEDKDSNLNIAKAFLKGILCEKNKGKGCDECVSCKKISNENYEDMYFIIPEKQGSIKDADIELAQEMLKNKPWFSNRNVLVIQNAERMTPKAQNRLLKTLEEPSVGTIIILLVDNVENILKTVASRCVINNVEPLQKHFTDDIENISMKIIDIIENKEKFYVWENQVDDILKDKEKLLNVLEYIQLSITNDLKDNIKHFNIMKRKEYFQILEEISITIEDIKKGINSSYAFKKFMIKFGG